MNELIRQSAANFSSPKKVLIIGNGAVVNGWGPMVSAIRASIRFGSLSNLSDTEIQKIVDLLPTIAVHEYNLFRAVLINGISGGMAASDQKNVLQQMKNFFEFVNLVGDRYNSANLPFRPEIGVVEKIVDSSTGTITLNYDNSVWKRKVKNTFVFKNLLQIHGRGVVPESLYFPTDSTILDELTNVTNLIRDPSRRKSIQDELLQSLSHELGTDARTLTRRMNSITLAFRTMHALSIDWLASAEELVIWGVGLNPYDAEFLSLAISISGTAVKRKKMTVINPCDDTIEKTRILFRIDSTDLTIIKP